MSYRPCRVVAASVLAAAVSASAFGQPGGMSFRDLAATIVKGSKGIESLRGRLIAGFQTGECKVDTGGLVASIECANQRALDQQPATLALDDLLKRARAELKAPDWKETKWLGAKVGASFKHGSGAEIDIGIPQDLGAGLPSSYGPVLVIALAADDPR